jgi:hypothetical protein
MKALAIRAGVEPMAGNDTGRYTRMLLVRYLVLFLAAIITWSAIASAVGGNPAGGPGSILASALATIGTLVARVLDRRCSAFEQRRLALTTVQSFPVVPAMLLPAYQARARGRMARARESAPMNTFGIAGGMAVRPITNGLARVATGCRSIRHSRGADRA